MKRAGDVFTIIFDDTIYNRLNYNAFSHKNRLEAKETREDIITEDAVFNNIPSEQTKCRQAKMR